MSVRTLAVFGIAIIASIGFVVIAAKVRNGTVDRLDVSTELAVHQLDGTVWDALMKGATLIGSSLILLPVVTVVLVLAVRRHERAMAVILAVDAIVVIAVAAVLKVMFARDRPTLFEKISLPDDYSFPSGHAMSAMGIYGVSAAVLIVLYPRAKAPLIVATTILIGAIGFSRVYLGVHWPFDVLGGFVGGIPPLAVSVHLLHRLQRRMRDRNLADVLAVDGKPTP